MNRKFGINTDSITAFEKVGNTKFIKKAGFDCFTFYHYLGIGKNHDMADSLGLAFDHINVYHLDSNLMWNGGDSANSVIQNMKSACASASSCAVPVVSFNICTLPSITATEAGFANFDKVIAEAKAKRVVLAFRISENHALINEFAEKYADNDTVRYCYDNTVNIDGISETVKSRIITSNINDLNGTVANIRKEAPFCAIVKSDEPEYADMTAEEFLATVLAKLKALDEQ